MSDNHRRYRSIRSALCQLFPQGIDRNAKDLLILAALISGIVGSQRTNYPKIASKVPDTTKLESRVKRFSRWINQVDAERTVHLMPFTQELLANLAATQSLVLVMDGSEVGRGCLALVISVIYRQRALPLAWIVVKGKKGHFPEATHVELLQKLQTEVPQQADVIFLGDGEFDGTVLQAMAAHYGWEYVCRTASNTILIQDGEEFAYQSLSLQPGECWHKSQVAFTRKGYGPVMAIGWWRTGYQEPIYLVTNLDLVEEACHWYQKRFRIETFFSDQKSRGFYLHKCHLATPERLARLMLAAFLAYIWVIFLGRLAQKQGLDKTIHRTDRCDLSLFQLGLRLLDYLMDNDLPIPISFNLSTCVVLPFVR